jgi:mRNA interferase HigB
MKVVGVAILDGFSRHHADVRSQIKAWLAEVEEADWNGPQDIKKRFPSASFVGNNRVVFNIRGNSYRLDVKVNYKNKVVLIKRCGTHAEYDRWTF